MSPSIFPVYPISQHRAGHALSPLVTRQNRHSWVQRCIYLSVVQTFISNEINFYATELGTKCHFHSFCLYVTYLLLFLGPRSKLEPSAPLDIVTVFTRGQNPGGLSGRSQHPAGGVVTNQVEVTMKYQWYSFGCFGRCFMKKWKKLNQ